MEYYKRRKNKKPIDPEDYWHNPIDPDGNVRLRLEERDKFLLNFKAEIDHTRKLSGRLLDIGCGLGYFLSALPEFERYGTEVSDYATKEASKYGAIQRDLNYPERHFDVITMLHVIEHIEKPEKIIVEIRKILKKRGTFIIATPDFDSGCARRFGDNYRLLNDDTHISLFTREGMFRFLQDFGFKINYVDYPFFDTEYFTEENLLRMFDTSKISPPFYGNFMTFYCTKEDI